MAPLLLISLRRSIFPDDGADTAADDAKSRSDAAAHEFPDGSADAARTWMNYDEL